MFGVSSAQSPPSSRCRFADTVGILAPFSSRRRANPTRRNSARSRRPRASEHFAPLLFYNRRPGEPHEVLVPVADCGRPVEKLLETIEEEAGDRAAFLSFEDETPALLPYATLLPQRASVDPILAAITGVYEWQQSPLLFLVDGERVQDEQELNALRRRIAMRGDTPYIGVVRPGQLTIYRVSIDRVPLGKALVPLGIQGRAYTFSTLANERPGAAPTAKHCITSIILRLLDD